MTAKDKLHNAIATSQRLDEEIEREIANVGGTLSARRI